MTPTEVVNFTGLSTSNILAISSSCNRSVKIRLVATFFANLLHMTRFDLILKIVLAKQLDVIPSIVRVVKPFSDTVCQNLSVQKENDKRKSIYYEHFQNI